MTCRKVLRLYFSYTTPVFIEKRLENDKITRTLRLQATATNPNIRFLGGPHVVELKIIFDVVFHYHHLKSGNKR